MNCDKSFVIKMSKFNDSKNKQFFCCRKCKDSAFRIDSGKEIIRPVHYKDGYSIYRSRMKEELLIRM